VACAAIGQGELETDGSCPLSRGSGTHVPPETRASADSLHKTEVPDSQARWISPAYLLDFYAYLQLDRRNERNEAVSLGSKIGGPKGRRAPDQVSGGADHPRESDTTEEEGMGALA